MADRNSEQLAKIVNEALALATRVHDELGPDGAKEVRLSPVGEMSLECDIRCEQAVIETLREAGLSGTAYTEEHGIVTLGTGRGLTITLDGLDGTRRYKTAPGRERYATMVAVLDGDDPSYDDYLVCATKEHAFGRLFRCTKGGGAWLDERGTTKRLTAAPVTRFEDVRVAYFDHHWPINETFFRRGLPGMDLVSLSASCIYYEDLAAGQAQLVLECTRKRNLELACGYGLVREAGGTAITPDGLSLGTRRYKSFGQMDADGDLHIPIITACSRALALETLERIRRTLSTEDWAALAAGQRNDGPAS